MEQRIASLEGGVGALLAASGQAAETLAILNLAQAGDHIVSSPSLCGDTYNLFHYTLPKLGIETTFVTDPGDSKSWRAAVRPNTKAFFGESISNPKQDVLDIEPIVSVAHGAGVPLIVDNTIPTPYLLRPLEWGADIIVHSAAKYLGSRHRDRWRHRRQRQRRLRRRAQPLPRLQPAGPELPRPQVREGSQCRQRARPGPVVHPEGPGEAAARPRPGGVAVQRVLFFPTVLKRCRCASSGTCRTRRPWRSGSRRVKRWRALPTPDCRAPRGTGSRRSTHCAACAVLAVEINGGIEAGRRFVDAHELHSHVANIGDVRSLVIYPASTTHSQLSVEEQAANGVTPGLVRLAVGLEHIDDILADLEAGFRAAKSEE